MPLAIQDFALSDYPTVWTLQKRLVQQRLNEEIPDTLLIGEHPPVITLGRGSHAENLLNPSVPVHAVERGGDVTYHGPGQLIAYPIFHLPVGQRDLHQYLRNLETLIILTLQDFGITGQRNPGWTGVWVEAPEGGQCLKLASIGVSVKKWVTYHGLALNVCTDLAAFSQMNPCGLQSQVMTSMQAVLKRPISVEAVKERMVAHFQAHSLVSM
ncbi:lipoyl(octanoyl) transferase LipB [Vampirovibrio sp.]|uniref:lipoyl(octanoyl) transferase LipB n=1 Tax=Vampirovibrio sp. TaxID=2717857 RepID=UPI0035932A8C